MSREFFAAILRQLARYSGAVLLFSALAAAQAAAPKPVPTGQQEQQSWHRYVDAVPKTPGDYKPITPLGQLEWFTHATVGPKSLVGGLFSSGLGTALNSPHEYGTQWEGFGKRYGMRMTGISTGNAMEAGLGAVWGEDPRYFYTVHAPFKERVKNVVDLTFRAYRPDGERHLAYARFLAIFGNNFLSNTWRAPSESDWQHAMVRSGEGFAARALGNAFSEFAPVVWRKIRHQPDPYPAEMTRP
jgi:hypothetical protein